MQIRENRRNVAEPRFLCNNSSKSILNTLEASQIWNGCASQERVAEIKSGANYCCSYGFGSLSSERSPNVTQRTNMEITSLACFRHLLIKGHCWVKVNTQILNWRLNLVGLEGDPGLCPWDWSARYCTHRRERPSLLDLLSEFGLISDGWLGSISPLEIGPMHLSVEGLRPWDWSYPVLQYLREWPTPTVVSSLSRVLSLNTNQPNKTSKSFFKVLYKFKSF